MATLIRIAVVLICVVVILWQLDRGAQREQDADARLRHRHYGDRHDR